MMHVIFAIFAANKSKYGIGNLYPADKVSNRTPEQNLNSVQS